MKTEQTREAWNKGKLIGRKPQLRPKDVWAIRIYLQNTHAIRDLAMFNLATVSCVAATSSVCESAMLPTAIRCFHGR